MSPTASPIRIVIADDHPIFRKGVRLLLEAEEGFSVLGEAEDGEQAADLARDLGPDVLLLDLAMPRVPGLEALRHLDARNDPVRTIVLTASIARSEVVTALQLGARGVVLKDTATPLLFKAVQRVVAGEYWVGRGSMGDLVEALRTLSAQGANGHDGQRPFGLTRREMDIVSAVAGGSTNKEIAASLTLSEDTVKHHLTNVFNKTGVSNRVELALFAVHHRLVDET
jgi:DNA-binding NarL/FixJ family response regulator